MAPYQQLPASPSTVTVAPFVVVHARHHPERANGRGLPRPQHRSPRSLLPQAFERDFLLRTHSPSKAFESPG